MRKKTNNEERKISGAQLNFILSPMKCVWCTLYLSWVCMRVAMQVCKPMLASPSPEQKGFLQMCGTPSPWKSGSKVFLFLSEASLCYWLWVISLGMFSTAEAVWADDKPNAADVWAVHIRGRWYGWQWLSRYVCYFTATGWRTVELVASRLLVLIAMGGCWCSLCSCLLTVLSKAPDKNSTYFLVQMFGQSW